MIKKIFFLLLVILIFAGCKRDPLPSKAIDRKTFINMLVDIHIAEGMHTERRRINLDSLQSTSVYLSVLKKYHVSEDKMLITTLYYSRNSKAYDKIFTEVLSKITIMTEELNKKPHEPKKK